MLRHITTRVAGLIIVIAGLWGGLIPFIGPYFHFTLGPDHAWTWTTGRLWLVVLPAAASVLGGLILMAGGPRVSGRLGALIALAGGAWFAVGPDVSRVWNHGISAVGATHGHHVITRMLELLTLHSGIGVLIVALAAYSLPGVTAVAVGRRRHGVAEDAAVAGTGAAVGAAEMRHHDRRVAEREDAEAPVAEREGATEPVARREAAVGTTPATARAEEPVDGGGAPAYERGTAPAEEPAATPAYEQGTGPAQRPAATPANEPAGQPGGPANEPAGQPAGPATQTQTVTRRRGGLFSRR